MWDTGEAVGEAKVLRLRLGLQPLRLLPLRLEGVLLVLGELRRVRGRGGQLGTRCGFGASSR